MDQRQPDQNNTYNKVINFIPIGAIALVVLYYSPNFIKSSRDFIDNPNKITGLSFFAYITMLVMAAAAIYIYQKTLPNARPQIDRQARQQEIEMLLKQAKDNSEEVEAKLDAIKREYGIDFDNEILPEIYRELESEFKLIIQQFTCKITQVIARDPTVFCYDSKGSSSRKSFTEVYNVPAILGYIGTIDKIPRSKYVHPTSNIEIGRDALMSSVNFDHSNFRKQLLSRLEAFAAKAKTIKAGAASFSSASASSTSVVSSNSSAAPAILRPAVDQAANINLPHTPRVKKD